MTEETGFPPEPDLPLPQRTPGEALARAQSGTEDERGAEVLINPVTPRRRATLTQEPAEDCCPAAVATFKGLTLECESDPGHTGMHYDVDQGIWWAHQEEANGADPVAAERERCAQLAERHSAICARLPDQPLAVTTSGAVTAWDGSRESPVISFAALLRQDQP